MMENVIYIDNIWIHVSHIRALRQIGKKVEMTLEHLNFYKPCQIFPSIEEARIFFDDTWKRVKEYHNKKAAE